MQAGPRRTPTRLSIARASVVGLAVLPPDSEVTDLTQAEYSQRFSAVTGG